MAKGTAVCTCKVCGKKFEKEFIEVGKGASTRLDEKIEWAENGGIDMCPECYKAQKRAEETAEGLTCAVRIGTRNGKIYAVFGGDSYNHREQLKVAGCKWTDEYPSDNHVANLINLGNQRKAWVYVSKDMEAVRAMVEATGAKTTWPTKMDIAVHNAVKPQDTPVAPEAPETPKAPKAPKAKKLSVDGAVYRLSSVSSKKDLAAVLEACSVATLKVIAKAFEPEMGVKVLSKFRRAELLDVLNNHSNWLLQMTSYDRALRIKDLVNQYAKIKALKASKNAADWQAAWTELKEESINVQTRALMACTKKALVAYLSVAGTYTTKQRKLDIVSHFMDRKVA